MNIDYSKPILCTRCGGDAREKGGFVTTGRGEVFCMGECAEAHNQEWLKEHGYVLKNGRWVGGASS